MEKEQTIDIAPVRQWLELLSSLGANRKNLLHTLSVKESVLLERDSRIPSEKHHAMLRAASIELKQPGIILLCGIKTTPQSLGVVGHLMMNCETLLDAGRQLARYASVLSQTGSWYIEEQGDSYLVHYARQQKHEAICEIEEASLSSCLGVLRSLVQKEIIPEHVQFTHSDPGYLQVYNQVFAAPIFFEQKDCFIKIAADDAHLPLPMRQSYIYDLLQHHAQELIRKLDDANAITSSVSKLVTANLANGRVNIDWISEQMCMSRWTLTRHLKQEGTTFNQLVKNIRDALAQKYLHDKSMSVSEIAFLLGYSEPSAFQRAFRGWHNCTPSDFRTHH